MPATLGLESQVVQHLWDKFRRAQMDLFASLSNAHCPMWYSMSEPPGHLSLDTLAHDWPGLELYTFPPLSLIQAVLDRTRMEEHCLLLVASY